jgi:NADPH:quinone reductase
MKAVMIRRFGGPEVLEFVDVPSREPGPGQVRIRVGASSVSPIDISTRSGALAYCSRSRSAICRLDRRCS